MLIFSRSLQALQSRRLCERFSDVDLIGRFLGCLLVGLGESSYTYGRVSASVISLAAGS